ncbi:MAG: glycosyltransferase family 4 protein [Bacteroidales bacterium]
MRINKVAIVGNYPPRKCGIATFTRDMNKGIAENGIQTEVVAINDGYEKYAYPPEVTFEIEQNNIASYISAANYLNTNDFDAVILQHEFGIFGGADGRHIVQLLKRLRMPVYTTLHTILDTPTSGQRKALEEISNHTEAFIAMSKMGVEILTDVYGFPREKIRHIHHGVHKMVVNDIQNLKQKLGVEKRKMLLTFGLLSKNKSIEVVINALPSLVAKHKDLVYVVLGATHPHVVKHEGEAYRHSLIQLVNKLGLQKHVIFVDRFISDEELFEYLQACDIYVIPYFGEKQITSGTLIYAMSAGKPIVSTPFWYAKEMLAEERGVLFNFGDYNQLSRSLADLLKNETIRKKIAGNALALAKECYWENIGYQYIRLIDRGLTKKRALKTEQYQVTESKETNFILPPIKLTQLAMLTDDTGILQHARYNVPDRSHGYCIDDNARALMLSVMLQNDFQDTDELKRLSGIYLSFIDYAYNPKVGKFRNFMSYDRQWLEEAGSEDSQGRTIWALGYASASTNDANFYHHSNYLFDKAVDIIPHLKHPRALAYAVLGLAHYVEVTGHETRKQLLKVKARELAGFFDATIDNKQWPWFDKVVTYGNSRIPQALITAGMLLEDNELAMRGIRLLDWLISKQFNNGFFSPIGNNGWLTPDGKAAFDQQPLEAHGMIDTCLQAEKFLNDSRYSDFALKAFAWFTGENDLGIPIYDFATGGCRDGLHPGGVNYNQGAESTISWLMSLLNISFYLQNKKLADYDIHQPITH